MSVAIPNHTHTPQPHIAAKRQLQLIFFTCQINFFSFIFACVFSSNTFCHTVLFRGPNFIWKKVILFVLTPVPFLVHRLASIFCTATRLPRSPLPLLLPMSIACSPQLTTFAFFLFLLFPPFFLFPSDNHNHNSAKTCWKV